jgi:hypothetical protein
VAEAQMHMFGVAMRNFQSDVIPHAQKIGCKRKVNAMTTKTQCHITRVTQYNQKRMIQFAAEPVEEVLKLATDMESLKM